LLPEQGVGVAELQRQFGSVAMVGDGINDARRSPPPIRIVMGAIGSTPPSRRRMWR
jgi:hypothetical protein